MNHRLRALFFAGLVRPLLMVVLGLRVKRRELLPEKGPAFVVANHNSHLDALVLMSIFPLRQLPRLRPVAAADYFLRNRWMAWFALRILGIIPIARRMRGVRTDPLAPISDAIGENDIVILFPEGTRGEPERLDAFRAGIAHLAERHPEVPITPVFLRGLGKALPRGEALLVPFFCDIVVGKPVARAGDRKTFIAALGDTIKALGAEIGH